MQLRGKVLLGSAIAVGALLVYSIGFMQGAASSFFRQADSGAGQVASETKDTAIPTTNRTPTFFENVVKQKAEQESVEGSSIDNRPEQNASIDERAVMVSEQLHVVPDSVITSYLTDYLGVDAVSRIENPREFAEKIVSVITSEDDSEPSEGALQSYASLSPATGLRLIESSVSLDQFASVYIHFYSEAGTDLDLLLKWKNLSSGQTIELAQTGVVSSQPANYHAYRPQQGWEPGRYQVLAYDLYGDNELRSSIQFQVDAVNAQDPSVAQQVNHEAINEMMSVGQAVRKNLSQ